MSDKLITGSASLFDSLFDAPQSAKAKEEYRRALEKAAREEAEASKPPSQSEDKSKWFN